MWKNFFFFTKGERSGIAVLCCLIVLMFSVNFCYPVQTSEEKQMLLAVRSDPPTTECAVQDTNRQVSDHQVYKDSELPFSQVDSLKNDSKHSIYSSPNDRKSPHTKRVPSSRKFMYDTVRVELNSADTTELKRLRGIGSVLSARIVKYRRKIGGFTSVEELKNVYGLPPETYESILPHVWIAPLVK